MNGFIKYSAKCSLFLTICQPRHYQPKYQPPGAVFFNLIFKFQCSSNLDHTLHLIFGVHGTNPYCCFFGSDHGYFLFNQTKFRKYQFKIEWDPPEKIREKVFLENIISQCVSVDQKVQEIGTRRKFCTFGSVLFRPRLVYYNYLIRSLIESTSWK